MSDNRIANVILLDRKTDPYWCSPFYPCRQLPDVGKLFLCWLCAGVVRVSGL